LAGTTTLKDFCELRFLLSLEGIGIVKIRNLLSAFHSVDNIFEAGLNDLAKVEGIGMALSRKLIGSFSQLPTSLDLYKKEYETLTNKGISVSSFLDETYPQLLKRIYDPPMLIYVKGTLLKKDNFPVAIVGTREPSTYGKVQAEKFSSELARNGITVTSGLARGIDSIAHQTALQNGGRTLAVLGCGLDVVYPPENKKLYETIPENGALISEFPLGTKPDAQNFPTRNRIISGLSLGTVVVESGIQGGALQTAAFALDQGREVFAVPGNLGVKQSEGTNALIQKGEAKLVKNCEDILLELELKLKPVVHKHTAQKININLNLFEQKIVAALGQEEKHIDDLAILAGLSTADCLINLLSLEFKGIVKQLPGKIFVCL